MTNIRTRQKMPLITRCLNCDKQVSTTAEACPDCGQLIEDKAEQGSTRPAVRIFAILFAGILAIILAHTIIVGISIRLNSTNFNTASKGQPPGTGQTWYTNGRPIGCRKQADLQQLMDLAEQKDTSAFLRVYMEKAMGIQCLTLAENTPVYIATNTEPAYPCVRPEGAPNCFFVMSSFLQSVPQGHQVPARGLKP
jgi:hypothetical protein